MLRYCDKIMTKFTAKYGVESISSKQWIRFEEINRFQKIYIKLFLLRIKIKLSTPSVIIKYYIMLSNLYHTNNFTRRNLNHLNLFRRNECEAINYSRKQFSKRMHKKKALNGHYNFSLEHYHE